MIATGKYFEAITSMLIHFRTEVEAASALGLHNINKHAEHFFKRILNLTYNYELENLNKGKSNFPAIDLGDSSEGIAFQITSTRKSEKIEDTLKTCLAHKHYETFKNIYVFILTQKQSSYNIKTVTSPHFDFVPATHIRDISDLLKDIEHIAPVKMKALHDYLLVELEPVINQIKDPVSLAKKSLLDTAASMHDSKMPVFSLWCSTVKLTTETMSVPDIYHKLKAFLPTPMLKLHCLPVFNEVLRQAPSSKELLYLEKLAKTHASNYFFGNALLLEPSSITAERANYNDGDILSNLLIEMRMLLTSLLFFSKHARSNYEINVTLGLETNGKVYFHPADSLVASHVLANFQLENPFNLELTINNVHRDTLTDLLQQIMDAFVCPNPSILQAEPFFLINRDTTVFAVEQQKKALGIQDYHLR